MRQTQFAGIYDKIDFPAYRFEEYPKAVYPPGGPVYKLEELSEPDRHMVGKPIPRTVYSEEEEELVMRAAPESAGDVGLEALRKEAEQLGIQYDGRWGVPRLQAAIEAERHREPTLR